MILSLGPDGTKSQSLGTAAVCWGCGYVGLPKNPDAGENAIAQCSGCGSNEQTNYVKVKQPQGTVIPWMENKVSRTSNMYHLKLWELFKHNMGK